MEITRCRNTSLPVVPINSGFPFGMLSTPPHHRPTYILHWEKNMKIRLQTAVPIKGNHLICFALNCVFHRGRFLVRVIKDRSEHFMSPVPRVPCCVVSPNLRSPLSCHLPYKGRGSAKAWPRG